MKRSQYRSRVNNTFVILITMVLFACSSHRPVNSDSNDLVESIRLVAGDFSAEFEAHIMAHDNFHSDIVCQDIPLSISVESHSPAHQLCSLTMWEHEPLPVTKVAFFTQATSGKITVLESLSDAGLASFYYFWFSETGKYLTIEFGEEGHPFYVFFDAVQFLTNPQNAQVGEVFDEYFLDHIEHIFDNGDIIYALREDTIYSCLEGDVEIIPAAPAIGETLARKQVKRCLMQHNLFDLHQNMSSGRPPLPNRSKRRINMPYVCKHFAG